MKVIVLDYSCPRVAIIKDVPADVCNDGGRLEEYLSASGFHPSNCSWMSVEDWTCNDIEVFKYRAVSEHVGGFDINTDGMGDPHPEEYQEEEYQEEPENVGAEYHPREELMEGEELAEGEELN